MVLSRNSRSSRKRPAATSAARSALVAERMRTSMRRAREAPTRSTSPVSSTRRSLACCRSCQRPDLVEQQRAALGQLEAADPVGARVGEGALHVAEHLALEQAFGEPAEVHGHQRPRRAGRGGVEPLRHDLLAGAVLAA